MEIYSLEDLNENQVLIKHIDQLWTTYQNAKFMNERTIAQEILYAKQRLFEYSNKP